MSQIIEPTIANGVNGQTNGINGQTNGHPAPTHPGLVRVFRGKDADAYDTYSTSEVDLPASALFAPIVGWTPASYPTYATVQTSATTHLNLNSDLLYINHSCAPSLEFHVDNAKGVYEVRVARDRALRKGDLLSFFYPSTEWDMAQKFDCLCKQPECWGSVGGAKDMAAKDDSKLATYFLNPHIKEQLAYNLSNGKAA